MISNGLALDGRAAGSGARRLVQRHAERRRPEASARPAARGRGLVRAGAGGRARGARGGLAAGAATSVSAWNVEHLGELEDLAAAGFGGGRSSSSIGWGGARARTFRWRRGGRRRCTSSCWRRVGAGGSLSTAADNVGWMTPKEPELRSMAPGRPVLPRVSGRAVGPGITSDGTVRGVCAAGGVRTRNVRDEPLARIWADAFRTTARSTETALTGECAASLPARLSRRVHLAGPGRYSAVSENPYCVLRRAIPAVGQTFRPEPNVGVSQRDSSLRPVGAGGDRLARPSI